MCWFGSSLTWRETLKQRVSNTTLQIKHLMVVYNSINLHLVSKYLIMRYENICIYSWYHNTNLISSGTYSIQLFTYLFTYSINLWSFTIHRSKEQASGLGRESTAGQCSAMQGRARKESTGQARAGQHTTTTSAMQAGWPQESMAGRWMLLIGHQFSPSGFTVWLIHYLTRGPGVSKETA